MRYFFILFTFLLGLISCTNQTNNNGPKPFKHVLDFKKEAQRLDSLKNIEVIKTLWKDGKSETIDAVPEHWERKELLPFIEADFNFMKLKDKYTETHHKIEYSGLETFTYKANDEKLAVQLAEYTYQNGQLKSAFIKRKTENKISGQEQILVYEPDYGYSIRNRQKVELVYDEKFLLKVEFKNAARKWMGYLNLRKAKLPLRFEWRTSNGKPEMTIINAAERIVVSDISQMGDSTIIRLPVFQSEFHVLIENEKMLGYWLNLDKGPDYKIPFSAQPYSIHEEMEMHLSSTAPQRMDGKWETTFGEDEKAIGLFGQHWNKVYGTFATETGDYRYLEGTVSGDSFELSTFDGSHAFLFTGKVKGDVITNGIFYSGNHYEAQWVAKKNADFELTHADSLTSLKEGSEKVSFTFPNLEGQQVSLSDEKYKRKVVMLSIFGSWCPNCMDETAYYSDLYRKYNKDGLEIIGLAFERSTEFEKASMAVKKAKDDLNAPYDFLIAGKASKKAAAEALPMLNHVLSFPTTIFLNKNGDVVKIHTGFYGPGTGKYYEEFTSSTKSLIEKLLNEK